MSRRIGERLVAQGLLTQSQVDDALQNQLLSGGAVGTSLLDLGLIDEDVLGRTLAELLGVEYIDRERLSEIPADVIAELSSCQAEKHHVIPIACDEQTLHVATVHPKLVGSLSRLTGRKIVISLAPEVRIYEALEQYYGVTMRPRHTRIIKDLEARRQLKERKQLERVTAPASSDSVPAPRVGPTEIDLPEEYGYGRNWRSVAADLDNDEPSQAAPDRRSAEPLPRPRTEFRRLEDVFERFCDANFKEELFEASLGYVSQKLETCILFGVRSKLAQPWDWRSKKLTAEAVESLRLPIGGGSILGLLLGRSHYRGPLEEGEVYRRFYTMLDMDPPAELLLLPVYVSDRLVAVLYGDNGTEPIAEDTGNYTLLAQKLSAAFHLLILKMKIRA